MTPESWTVIGTGLVILAAITASHRQLRGEINEMRGEISRLRERMAKLEGLREAISGRKAHWGPTCSKVRGL